MDFIRMSLSLRHTYIKLLVLKYRVEYSWRNLSTLKKVTSTLLVGSGVSISCFLIYKFFEKNEWSEDFKQADYHEVSQLSKRRKKGIPPGLYNDGNTCFANGTLQALASFPEFLNWLEDITNQFLGNQLTVAPSLQKLLKVLSNQCGNEDVYSALDVVGSLHRYGWVISNEQHDAYEFFQSLISTIDEEIQKATFVQDGEFNIARNFSCHIANRISRNLPTINNSKLTNPFKGSFAKKMCCLTCGYQYPIKFESFNSLILNLQKVSPYGCTLESCFEEFVGSEFLFDVCCDNCQKNHSGAVRRTFSSQMSLAKLPSCLCIELQRTYFDADGKILKNPMFVKFPEFLDVSSFTYRSQVFNKSIHEKRGHGNKAVIAHQLPKNNKKRLILRGGSPDSFIDNQMKSSPTLHWYRLCSVLLHYGNAHDGHFVIYRRATKDIDKWVYISDEHVRTVPKKRVFNSSAYLLFYEKM